MKISKTKIKNKFLFVIASYLTVITIIFNLFAFSLPHDFHCINNVDTSAFSNFLDIIERTHHDEFSNNTDSKDETNKQNHKQDNCPICNLSYFNYLSVCEDFSNNITLRETNEKPVYKIQTGFSSFSYFKFFLRSPPSFAA